MKKLISIFLISIFIQACSHKSINENSLHNEEVIRLLQDSITKISNKDIYFIEIPFSKLLSLYQSDSINFESQISQLGYSKKSSYIFSKEGSEIQIEGIGIGLYMFHNIPMLFRDHELDWLIYTFPIDKLSYYKTSILKEGDFTILYRQESEYIDKYNVNYINEVYVDKIRKLEYKISYYKSYGKLMISERSY